MSGKKIQGNLNSARKAGSYQGSRISFSVPDRFPEITLT